MITKILGFAAAFAMLVGTSSAQTITPAQPVVGGISMPKASGRFYTPPMITAAGNNAVPAANRLFAAPVFISQQATLDSLSFDIGTGNAAAWNARMCLYNSGADGLPGSLVVDSGTVAVASGSVTGVKTVSGLATVLGGPANYWVAFMADSASESLYSIGAAGSGPAFIISQSLLGMTNITDMTGAAVLTTGVYRAQTFGACPSTFGTVTYNSGAATPLVVLGF